MKVLVLYYSSYGHTFQMAQAIKRGADKVGGEVHLKRAPELVPQEIIDGDEGLKYGADLQKDIAVAKPDELQDYDAIIFGSPTRYGNMAAQMKNLIDQTGALWAEGKLVNKIAGVFSSTATPHGGQETTNLTMMITLMHHGMIIVPQGYTSPGTSTNYGGGTPYGPSTTAGMDGSRQPDEADLTIAEDYGKRIAEVTKRFLN